VQELATWQQPVAKATMNRVIFKRHKTLYCCMPCAEPNFLNFSHFQKCEQGRKQIIKGAIFLPATSKYLFEKFEFLGRHVTFCVTRKRKYREEQVEYRKEV